MRAVPQRRRPDQTVHGIDRMIRNIETGRFERSLSALTAAGALITAAEIYFEHDSASFGNQMMWLPVTLGPIGAMAGVAGFFSRRMAKTALPVASAAIVANGLQGTYLHARGIAPPTRWPPGPEADPLTGAGRPGRTEEEQRNDRTDCCRLPAGTTAGLGRGGGLRLPG